MSACAWPCPCPQARDTDTDAVTDTYTGKHALARTQTQTQSQTQTTTISQTRDQAQARTRTLCATQCHRHTWPHTAPHTDDTSSFCSVVFETSWLWFFAVFLEGYVVRYAQREWRDTCNFVLVLTFGWSHSFARAPARSFVQVFISGWDRNVVGA